MSVTINAVEKGSIAEKKKILPGDLLISVNGMEIEDVLDYNFYLSEAHLKLRLSRNGRFKIVSVTKTENQDIGLLFDTYLMDEQKSCRNKCIFCFIDQLPPNMRETLYFKDDDSRLSFLFGNYITLTSISEHEIERIIKMHISPINISVHTMNPKLRCKMMNNRFAGESLKIIKRFADAGIAMNTQLVLCPGINDGEELFRSLRELSQLFPELQSIACVPVGLTAHRNGLQQLDGYTPAQAAAVIDILEAFGNEFFNKHGTRLCYPADEFYIKAGRPLPGYSFYEEFAQLENGVGLCTLLEQEFNEALASLKDSVTTARSVTIATGESAAPLIKSLVDLLIKKWHNINVNVIPIQNDFFGKTITVAGLVTGRDLISQLKQHMLGDELLIPRVMLKRDEDIFLDDTTLNEVRSALNISVTPVANDGAELIQAILGKNNTRSDT